MKIAHKISRKLVLTYFFTLIVVTYPFICRYASPVPYINLIEFFLFVFWIIALIDCKGKIKIITSLAPICLYLVFYIVLTYCCENKQNLYDAVGSTFRLLFMYMTLAMFARLYFDFAFGVKLVRIIAFLASAYIMIQTIAFKVFGIILSSHLPFLPLLGDAIYGLQESAEFYRTFPDEFRAFSFFSEPSHVCMYLLLALTLELFLQRHHWIFYAAFFCISCFVDRSSTGIIMSVFIFGMFLFRIRKVNKRIVTNSLIGLGALGIGFGVFLTKTDIWNYFIHRTFAGGGV